MQEISINSEERNEIIDITDEVSKLVNIKSGLCVVYCPHTTAALTINENADPTVKTDMVKMLNTLVPSNLDYEHSEGNSDSHIKAALMGNSRTIIINNSTLELGTWEGIYFCEFDGPRKRKVYVKIIKG